VRRLIVRMPVEMIVALDRMNLAVVEGRRSLEPIPRRRGPALSRAGVARALVAQGIATLKGVTRAPSWVDTRAMLLPRAPRLKSVRAAMRRLVIRMPKEMIDEIDRMCVDVEYEQGLLARFPRLKGEPISRAGAVRALMVYSIATLKRVTQVTEDPHPAHGGAI